MTPRNWADERPCSSFAGKGGKTEGLNAKSEGPTYIRKHIYMGVSKNRGTPKLMVCNGKPC